VAVRCISENLWWTVIQDRASAKIHRKLLFALESARTRLAVAIAVETKSTPPDRWRYYLDTAERTCRLIRKLRKTDFHGAREAGDWARALETLQRLPLQDDALQLCRTIGNIVEDLE